MNYAFQEIESAYDIETLKEIVSHGCESGVCSQHIYYADTVKFFDKHEDEIVEYLNDNCGHDYVGEMLSYHEGNLRLWKNHLVWAFIEHVAMYLVDNHSEEYVPDYTLADSIVDDVLKSGYNPPGCMTDERYAHAG